MISISQDSLLCPTAPIFILRGVRSLIPGTFTNKILANLEIVSQDSPFSLYRNTRSRKGVAAVWQAAEMKAPGSWDI